ncbi:MAG: D-alanine--D-alanine ligase, partial [Salinisphaeraceae bacterium]|nr:D-alanine--D-alanine ligase [Salinisphaeraceae bacterium]
MSRRVKDAAEFGKVAVLMGGWSAEREVSLDSGAQVLKSLQAQGINAHAVDVNKDNLLLLKNVGFDRAFNILHGPGGEDGVVQSVLSVLGIPFTGSGVLASALSMDKLRTKQIWQASGIPTPEYRLLADDTDLDAVVDALGLPIFVKPATEGSSIGMSRVEKAEDLAAAYAEAARYNPVVIAESYVDGAEYTCAVLDGPEGLQPLPLIRVETPNTFYDFQAKYESDATQYHCPCGLPADTEAQLGALASQAFRLLGAQGWGRADFMLDSEGRPWFLELNTVPGMTSHSLVPMAAKQAGLDF